MITTSRRSLFGLLAAAPLLPVAVKAEAGNLVLGHLAGSITFLGPEPLPGSELAGLLDYGAVIERESPLEDAVERMARIAEAHEQLVRLGLYLPPASAEPAGELVPIDDEHGFYLSFADPCGGCVATSIGGAGGGAGPATADTGAAADFRLAGATP